MSKWSLSGLLAVLAGFTFGATVTVNPRSASITAHWTGANSGNWCDAANWEVEGLTESDPAFHTIPGVVKTVDPDDATKITLNGNREDRAVFDRATDQANVSCTNLECVGRVTFTGSAIPKFVFSGVLSLYTNGVLTVDASASHTPQLDGVGIGTYGTTLKPIVKIENFGSECLDINSNFGYCYYDPFEDASKYGKYHGKTVQCTIAGSGSVRLGGRYVNYSGELQFYVEQSGDAKLTCASTAAFQPRCVRVTRADSTCQVIEIPGGAKFGHSACGYDGFYFNSDTQITGEGSLIVQVGPGSSKNGQNSTIDVASGKRVVFESFMPVPTYYLKTPPAGSAFVKRSGGTLVLTCPTNAFEGVIEMQDNDDDPPGVIEFPAFGMAGAVGCIGKAAGISIANGASIRHTGAAETTDKILYLRGGSDTLELAGGDVTFSNAPAVGVFTNSAKKVYALRLVNDTNSARGTFAESITDVAPLLGTAAELAGTFPVSVDVASGIWRFTGAQSFTGYFRGSSAATIELAGSGVIAAPLALSGATVKIIGGTDTAITRTMSVTNVTGASKIVVTGKANITLSEMEMKAGSLDITADTKEVTIAVSGKTSSSAELGNFTLNGMAAHFDDDGKIVYQAGTKITGAQNVEVTGYQRYDLTNPENDYTGRTILHGTGGAWIYALLPGVIPDYDKVDVYENRITVPGFEWTDAQILSLANSAHLYTNAVIAVDTRNGDRTLALDDTKVTSSTFGIGNDGANTLTITGNVTKKMNFGAWNGTLKFDGQQNLKLGGGTVTGDYQSDHYGAVELDGVKASFATVAGERIIVGGRLNDVTKAGGKFDSVNMRGKFVVRDSELTSSRLNDYDIKLGGSGNAGIGVMYVEGEDTVITASVVVGQQYGSRAALYQTGGTFVNRKKETYYNDYNQSLGYNGTGYFELRGGRYVQMGQTSWASNASTEDAIFAQFGGEVLITAHSESTDSRAKGWYFGTGHKAGPREDGPHPLYYQRGGTTMLSNMNWMVSWIESDASGTTPTNGAAQVTLDGPTAQFELGATCSTYFCRRPGTRLTFNLNNGATFKTAKPLVLQVDPIDAGRENGLPREIIVNFNGGRIVATANENIFGNVASPRRVTRATVYEKGATIDTNGKSFTLATPLTAPDGKGVTSVAFNATEMAKLNLVGAPSVTFPCSNGGDYAAAFAEFDPQLGAVTNIRVTCTGYGYTAAPTVQVRYANSSYTAIATATIGDVACGGFVKDGLGTLTLAATNTYTGATVISNGVLKLAVDEALVSGNTVKFCGGKLEIGSGVECPTDLIFDVSGLDLSSTLKCDLVTGWTSSELPELTGTPEGEDWEIVKVGTTLRIKKAMGFIILVQ